MADPAPNTSLALASKALEVDVVVRGTSIATLVSQYTAEKLTEAQRTALIDDLAAMRDAKDNLERQMAELCKPFNDGLRNLRDKFKPTIEALQAAIAHGKGVEVAKRALERRAAAEAELAANAASALVAEQESRRTGLQVPEADGAVETKAAPTNITTGGHGRAVGRKTIKVKVTDKAAAFAKYPHLFDVDHQRAVLEVKAALSRGERELVGLSWEYEETIAVGRR